MKWWRAAAALLSVAFVALSCTVRSPEQAPRHGSVARCDKALPAQCPVGSGLLGRFERLPSATPPEIPDSNADHARTLAERDDDDDYESGSSAALNCRVPTRPMTDQAVRARLLYWTDRWAEAAPALLAVAEGRTGDECQTRELAEFNLMVTLYRIPDFIAMEDLMVAILRSPGHLKAREAAYLMVNHIQNCPSARAIDALEEYVTTGLGHELQLRPEAQRPVAYYTGRRLLERGQREAGRKRLTWLLDGEWPAVEARECLAMHDPR